MNTQDFIARLISMAPGVKSILEDHIKDNDEILPHIFIADVTRLMLNLIETDAASGRHFDSDPELISILKCMEEALEMGDAQVKNIVEVSFVENLDQNNEYFNSLRELLGDRLQKSLRGLNDYYQKQ